MAAASNDHGGRKKREGIGSWIEQLSTRECRTTQTAGDQHEPVLEQCHGELGPPNVHVANCRKGMSDGIIEFGAGQNRGSARRQFSSSDEDHTVRQSGTTAEPTTGDKAARITEAFDVEWIGDGCDAPGCG